MYNPRFGAGRSRSGRDGPVAIPKGERVQLRAMQSGGEGNGAALDVTKSLLTLAQGARAAPAESKGHQENDEPKEETGQKETQEDQVPHASVVKIEATASMEGITSFVPGVGESSITETQETFSQHEAVQEECKESVADDDISRRVSELIANSPDAGNEAASWYGQPLEYAAGFALRTQLLEPILGEFPNLDETQKSDISCFLGNYSRGQRLFLGAKDEIRHCSIQRIMHDDGPTLAMWWDGDKYLSYTNEDWSDWWIRRCHLFDPGCEMIKIVNESKETLGVAYYERNIIDKYLFDGETRGRVTLIRGIRLEPSLNPEAVRRSTIAEKRSYEVKYRGIASLLFCHILLTSVRYGTHGVAVNCPKNEVAERFYESFMGAPFTCEEDTGRRYYRMNSEQRWKVLRKAFRRQIGLWLQDNGVPRVRIARAASSPPAPLQTGNGMISTKTKRQLENLHEEEQDEVEEPALKRPNYTRTTAQLQDAPLESNGDEETETDTKEAGEPPIEVN